MTGTTAPLAANATVSSDGASAKRAQRYECAGVSFALPSDWEDATSFVARGRGAEPGAPLILKVARDRMAPSATLWSHVANVLLNVGRDTPGLELQESSNVEVAGRPGVVLRFRIVREAGTFEQYLVLLDPLDDPERRVSVFNLSGPETQSAMMREALGNILRSLRISGSPSESPSREARPTTSSGPTVAGKPADLDYRVPMPGSRNR